MISFLTYLHGEECFMERTIEELRKRVIELEQELAMYMKEQFVPPGHFYSPIPDLGDIRARETSIFNQNTKELPAINLSEQEQVEWLYRFLPFYNELPFCEGKASNLRYFYENPMYSYSDAIFLYCMIRYLKPQKIIEVGSGYSSCVILDTNELFFQNTIHCQFIEPYPMQLLKLIKADDQDRVEIIPRMLQNVDLQLFTQLTSGDILFVDSTHVSKVGSDVNHLFFEILPRLNPGVCIHFHDVFYPLEYPKDWIYQRIAWNESYILRAFLEYNRDFKIVLFNTFLEQFYEDFFSKEMPLCLKNPGGSIWIQKL